MLMVVLALSSLWAPGCASNVAPVTPPPPLTERVPDAPADDYVWIPGRWIWRGGGYLWAPGHWAVPPRPGARWVPDKWSPAKTTPDVPAHWE
jgi:hypothetical protein